VRRSSREVQSKRPLAAVAASVNARMRRPLIAAIAALVVPVGLGNIDAHAASPGAPTRGAAQAVFRAFWTGGLAIHAHNAQAQGVPAVLDSARIYPGLDDLQYCAQGWHVILLGNFDDPALYGGNEGLFDYLSTTDIRFALDGVPLATERGAITRLTNPTDVGEAFGVQFGAFLPPGSLTVGSHQIQTTGIDPVYGDFAFTTAFTVIAC
jgi:hypothetical protein